MHIRIALLIIAFNTSTFATTRFVCSDQNDLYKNINGPVVLERNVDDAIAHAAGSDALLILAEGYPAITTKIPAELWDQARQKHLHLYLEYPSNVPGVKLGTPKQVTWERAVIASDRISTELPKLQIISPQACTYLPASADHCLIAIARVAGFDSAVYGIPANASSLLFEMNDGNTLIATTRLSNFISARYAPSREWQVLWNAILKKLCTNLTLKEIQPLVRPAYSRNEPLPPDHEQQALNAAADWIHQSRLLLSSARKEKIHQLLSSGVENVAAPLATDPIGDGSLGILEGYSSGIYPDGSQLQRTPLRSDCQCESAMVLALRGNNSDKTVSTNLLNWTFFNSNIRQHERGNPKHPAFGLIAWGDISPAWYVANYGDDDARCILATIFTANQLNDPRWDKSILESLFANLRTTGKLGFRGDRIDIPQISSLGWKHFHDAETRNYSPHFESYLWACYLWAYRATGEKEFFNKAESGIRLTMENYPHGWRWQDNIERARMLLCLAWLVQTQDTPQHRQWLDRVATDLLTYQDECGAIAEHLGGTGGGHYRIPQSNQAYGTGETPLIQSNNDKASDQLYTTGFALFALHEAVAATHDRRLKAAEDKLADYLCRVQTKSDKLSQYSGWWFRAFDFKRWDYWASSSDLGWGVWSLEAGWAQAWTAATLGLRTKQTNFWDLTVNSKIAQQLPIVREEMAQNDGSPVK